MNVWNQMHRTKDWQYFLDFYCIFVSSRIYVFHISLCVRLVGFGLVYPCVSFHVATCILPMVYLRFMTVFPYDMKAIYRIHILRGPLIAMFPLFMLFYMARKRKLLETLYGFCNRSIGVIGDRKGRTTIQQCNSVNASVNALFVAINVYLCTCNPNHSRCCLNV